MRAFILTGSRDWTDRDAMRTALSGIPQGAVMIQGAARGADDLGARTWIELGGDCIAMPAPWDEYQRAGKRLQAGTDRNTWMLDVLLALRKCGYEVSVEAFSLPQSRGTRHMRAIAARVGVAVNEHGRIA